MCPLPIGAHTAGCCSGIHSGNSGFGTGPWGSSCGGFPFAPLVQGRRSDGLRAAAAAGGGTVAAAAGGGTVADRNAPRGWLAGTAQRSLEAGGIAHCSTGEFDLEWRQLPERASQLQRPGGLLVLLFPLPPFSRPQLEVFRLRFSQNVVQGSAVEVHLAKKVVRPLSVLVVHFQPHAHVIPRDAGEVKLGAEHLVVGWV